MITYVPCNGTNAANLLHCPTAATYTDRACAFRVAKRRKLTHVAHVCNGRAFELAPVG